MPIETLRALAILALAFAARLASAEVIEFEAKDTLTALEMNHGDELRFQLKSGRVVAMTLAETDAAVVETVAPGGIVYRFEARLRVDGQPMTLERYVCTQECFYEPYVIDGVRIWLDTVRKVFDLIPIRYPHQGNLQCLPRKDARLAVQDAALRICPQALQPWIEDDRNFLDVGACYNGDDCYLGPYLGQACHVGMDVNQVKGSVLFAPIDFDTHAYFNSLATGHNNNRWRGVRRWPGGDVWALQTHHLIELTVPQNTPLPAGTKYATTAGVHVGSHEHTHFEFKVGRPRNPDQLGQEVAKEAASIAAPIDFDDESTLAQKRPEVLHLDPWIIFRQAFEDRKTRRGELRAAMKPPGPARAGRLVTCSAEGSRPGLRGGPLRCYWTFGDGGAAVGPTASHVFARPGVYPVTLVVDDGRDRATTTHHVVVSGEPVRGPLLALTSPDEPPFRPRPLDATDVYGRPVSFIPHTLRFLARRSRPRPLGKTIHLKNLGGGTLAPSAHPAIDYEAGADWLDLARMKEEGPQSFLVGVDAAGLAVGTYLASVEIACQGAANSPQPFRVELDVVDDPPSREVTVDDADSGFYATPHFWVGHRFSRRPAGERGYRGFYLTNGARATAGEFARFTPDLGAGRYDVLLSEQTPFSTGVEFDVRVRCASGEELVRVRPDRSRRVGTFQFDEGTDGFVEIHAGGSKGLVVADAVTFRPN